MKKWNFSPGPTRLPEIVLQQMLFDIFDFKHTGFSITEISHRSDEFANIIYEAEKDLIKLMNLSSNDYAVLFMQGGASVANFAIPINISNNLTANFILSGYWSNRSLIEASKYCNVHVAADSMSYDRSKKFFFPDINKWDLSNNASYLHICSNETITGLEFVDWDNYNSYDSIPLVIDATSNFLSRNINMKPVGILFAGAQKNAGISGLTLVIIRKDLLERIPYSICPNVYNFSNIFLEKSICNTPPIFAIYVAGLMFKWLLINGGLDYFEDYNIRKSKLIYDYIDSSDFYVNYVEKKYRSRMNVTFNLADEYKINLFLKNANKASLYNLKGHRSFGGIRASIYNAMSIDGINHLINYMKDFEQHYG